MSQTSPATHQHAEHPHALAQPGAHWRLPLLHGLSGSTRAALEGAVHEEQVPKGHQLFQMDDPAGDLFILLEGKVKLTRPSRQPQPSVVPGRRGRPMVPPTRESLLGLVGPGEMFGELSVIDEGRRATTATAMLACQLWRLPGGTVRELMRRHHDFSQAMVQQLAHRIRLSQDLASGLVLGDVPGRVATVLVGLADRFGQVGETGIEVHHGLTQAELAQMVGASRESVNKVLTDFVARRWITTSGGSVLIREPDRLRARME